VTPRWVPGTLVGALLAGTVAALPAAAQTAPPPPPGTPVSPPPTGDVLPTPPPTVAPTTEPPAVLQAPATPPPTTATAIEPPAPTPSPRPTRPPAAPAPAAPPPAPVPPAPAIVGTALVVTGVATTTPARSGRAAGGDGLTVVGPSPAPEASVVPAPDLAAPGTTADRSAPTQRRLAPRPTVDEQVAAPAPGTAGTRSRAERGLFRRELLPLLLLGGAVATAYVACLQVAERRRQRRGLGG
jgi:hypothetical protein